jgi:mRNA interferase HigB
LLRGINPPILMLVRYKLNVTILVIISYNEMMRIISRRILREFWEKHPDSTLALQTWYQDVERATWKSPADIKEFHNNASFVANNRIVFTIKGNHYRLVVVVVYQYGVVYIRFVGTHQEYNRIDVNKI